MVTDYFYTVCQRLDKQGWKELKCSKFAFKFQKKSWLCKVNWKTLLQKYITNTIPTDYTFARPRRSSRALGIYLPSVVKENVEIYVSIDTSGSISQDDLTDFLSEMLAVA